MRVRKDEYAVTV